MTPRRRVQSALEYLITHGWAVIMLMTIGLGLVYMGRT